LYDLQNIWLIQSKKIVNGFPRLSEWSNIKRNIEKHELLPENLQSEMSKALYINYHKIDLKMVHATNKQVVKKREIVKLVIDVLLYTA
jgi:hypothetical protein